MTALSTGRAVDRRVASDIESSDFENGELKTKPKQNKTVKKCGPRTRVNYVTMRTRGAECRPGVVEHSPCGRDWRREVLVRTALNPDSRGCVSGVAVALCRALAGRAPPQCDTPAKNKPQEQSSLTSLFSFCWWICRGGQELAGRSQRLVLTEYRPGRHHQEMADKPVTRAQVPARQAQVCSHIRFLFLSLLSPPVAQERHYAHLSYLFLRPSSPLLTHSTSY